jgi:hypothetical protein
MQGEGEECVGRCGGFSRLLAFLVGASGELGCPFSSESSIWAGVPLEFCDECRDISRAFAEELG